MQSESTHISAQAALVIRGLFICEFAYSHWQNWSKMTIFQSKTAFLFAIQFQDSRYVPGITRETCTSKWSPSSKLMIGWTKLIKVQTRIYLCKCFKYFKGISESLVLWLKIHTNFYLNLSKCCILRIALNCQIIFFMSCNPTTFHSDTNTS